MRQLTTHLGSILITMAIGSGSVYAGMSESPNDTTGQKVTDLKELTVTSNTVKTMGPGQYRLLPLPEQKRLASNLIEVLSNINLSMLSINENDLSVSLSSGQPVSLFINGFPASSEEIKGILPRMIKYIDFLDHSSDPRFGGAPYVLNYVLRDDAGGFSKISLEDRFLNGNYNSGGVFNYISHRKLTYSLYLGGNNADYHHGGSSSTETFEGLLSSSYGSADRTAIPQRTSSTDRYSSHEWSIPLSARLSYVSPKFIMQQTLGYSHDREPHTCATGTNTYTDIPQTPDGTETFSRDERRRSNIFSWSAMYYFILPKSVTLNLLTDVSNSHNDNSSDYKVGATLISNPAKENALYVSALALLSKQWGYAHTLSLTGIFNSSYHRVDYFTGGGLTHYSLPGGLVEMRYNLYKEKINLSAGVGAEIERYDVSSTAGGRKLTEAVPMASLDVTVPVKKTMLSAYIAYKQGSMSTSEFTPDVRRLDEVMYFSGNPDLRVVKRLMTGCRVNWRPNSTFSLTPSLSYTREYDHILRTYSPYLDGVLRSYANIDSYGTMRVNVAAALNLLDNRLSLNANIGLDNYSFPGTYISSLTAPAASLSASFRTGDFRWRGAWTASERSRSGLDGSKVSIPSDYHIGGSWFKGSWSVGINLSNFFRTSWKVNETLLRTPVYGSNSTQWGVSSHARCTLTATYSFGYGKKITPDSELGRSAYGRSAILE